MMKIAATVCAHIFVIIFSVQCYSLNINFEHEVNNDLRYDEDLSAPEAIHHANKYEEPVTVIPNKPRDEILEWLLGGKLIKNKYSQENNDLEDGPKSDETQDAVTAVRSRVVRQVYPGQAPLYPKLPSSSPYNQYQQNSNYNNQNPPYNQYQPNNNFHNQNQQWLPPNNYTQGGYPSNGASSFNPSTQRNTTNGHNPYNPSQPQYPSYNNPGLNSNGPYPSYNNHNSSSPYPGYRAPNSTVYNSGSSRPPYGQNGQFNNNPYQSQISPYSPTTPGNRRPGTYDSTSNRPTYNKYNTSNWSGNKFNHSSGQPPYAQSGQNPQYINPYPNKPYGQQNSSYTPNVPTQGPYHNPTNGYHPGNTVRPGQYPPYNNTNNSWIGRQTNTSAGGSPYGQNPQNFNSYPQRPTQNNYNNYPGGNAFPTQPYGSDMVNLSNGYNPSIPKQPPYGGAPGQNQFRYPPGTNGTAHDPTRVSPEYFSYPH